MISDELAEYLRSWLIDATSPRPSRDVSCFGLCIFADNDLVSEMKAFWQEEGLNISFPFNPVEGSYSAEVGAGTCHLNPLRLTWVRERIAEYDHTLAMYEEEKRT